MNHPVVIIGAGLSGLYAASLLAKRGIQCRILESRDRIGGRAWGASVPDRPDLGRFDLGPTWYWPEENTIAGLVAELKLETFGQYNKGEILLERFQTKPPERCVLPESADDRRTRISGGISSLIDALEATLPPGTIELETRAKKISMTEAGTVTVEVSRTGEHSETIDGDAVILALPTRLVAKHIKFSPSIPENLAADLAEKPTWMAEQAKAVAVFDRPFWRDSGLSGFALSSVGPLQEIYDASPKEGAGALFGFFGIPASTRETLGEDKIVELVAGQLVKLFGSEANNPKAILYKDWASDVDTTVDEDFSPFKNYGSYGQPPAVKEWEGKLLFAGTETNSEYSGHLEGALQSAEQAVSKIIHQKSNF